MKKKIEFFDEKKYTQSDLEKSIEVVIDKCKGFLKHDKMSEATKEKFEANEKLMGERFDRVDQKLDSISTEVSATKVGVKKLELWRAGIVAGLTVAVFFSGFLFYVLERKYDKLDENLERISDIRNQLFDLKSK